MKISLSTSLAVWLVLNALLDLEAAAPKYDPEKLRGLVRLPLVNFSMGFGYQPELGFTFGGEPTDLSKLRPPAERIAELKDAPDRGANDAERYAELGTLYAKVNNLAESQAACKRAVELFQERVKDNPKDGWLRMRLGVALASVQDMAGAEARLREAVALAPEDWRCWTSLGAFLSNQSMAALGLTNAAALAAAGTRPVVAPEARAKAKALREEAGKCYQRAVAAAPQETEVYQGLLTLNFGDAMFRELLGEAEPARTGSPMGRLFTPEFVANAKKAAQYATNDAFAIGLAAFAEAMVGLENPIPSETLGLWPELNERARGYAKESIARLEAMSQKSDPLIASRALASLAGLRFLLQNDLTDAERNLRKSLELRPASDAAWELLGAILVKQERWSDLATAGEARVRAKDSGRARLALAKVYEKLGRTNDILAQLSAALDKTPYDLLLHTAVAALDLQQARDEKGLREIKDLLEKIAKKSAPAAPNEDKMAFHYLCGLYMGIVGDREPAAALFRQLKTANPSDSRYQEALDALGL